MKKIKDQDTGEESLERVLSLNGTIAEESWFDDDVTPQMFRDELNAGEGDITLWQCVSSVDYLCLAEEMPL